MPDEPKQESSRKAVGIYDRPASADWPKRTILIVAIVIVVAVATWLWMR